MVYELTRLSDHAPLGQVDSLPFWLNGIGASDDQIRDLGWAGYSDQGFWPINFVAPSFDPATETTTNDIAALEPDATARAWTAVYAVRDLTADELAARNPVPQQISDRQFFQALALQGMISNEEALAAVKTGEIPSAMASFIATFPSDQQFSAQMLLAGATIFERANPLVPAFMAAQTPPMTDADINDLWRFASAL